MKFTTISILGCGWLGIPLAEKLIKNGFLVKGSTTKTEKLTLLQAKSIKPYLLNLNPDLTKEAALDFFESDVLVIDIPPKISLKGPDFHVKQIESLIPFIEQSPIQLVIFTSSTSVYAETNQEVFEENASEQAHPVLWKVEQLLKASSKNTIVLRLAGLMGYDRIPAKYFAGKKGLSFGETPVNYIHQDDAVGIISSLIESDISTGIFNAVAPIHPKRKEIYLKNCSDLGFEVPEFLDAGPQNFKIVNGDKLTKALNYDFKFKNPLDFYYQQN
jgi:nucleoside-diphosphate-sugar epimerase